MFIEVCLGASGGVSGGVWQCACLMFCALCVLCFVLCVFFGSDFIIEAFCLLFKTHSKSLRLKHLLAAGKKPQRRKKR